MPLYLVRWPNFSAAFVNATDEVDLVDQLDMLSDPSGCRWQVYRGPLHIEMDLPIEYARTDDRDEPTGTPEERYRITKLPNDEFSHFSVQLSIPSTDTTDNMLEMVWKFAFPNLAKVLHQEDLTEDELKGAALQDLDVLAQSDWQRAQRDSSPDHDAAIARMLGTSVRQVKGILSRRRAKRPAPSKPTRTRKPRKRTRR